MKAIWTCTIIPSLLLAALLATGLDTVWDGQMGQWAAGARILTSHPALDFALLVLCASTLCVVLGKRLVKALPFILAAILLAAQAWCVAAAWDVCFDASAAFPCGRLPQGIDHPAFLFRLREFFSLFPRALGGYNPYWNAGTEHFIGVTSGSHNFGLLISPLAMFFPLESVYSPALLFWMSIGFPWLTVCAFRRAGMRWCGALAGGLAMIAFTRAEFLFFWQSGNIGGMVTAGLSPILVAIGYRVAIQRRGTWPDVAALAICAWLVCIWTPGVFTCAGLSIGWLLSKRRWSRRSNLQLVIAGSIALVLLAPWFWVTLFPSRGIVSYVSTTHREPLRIMAHAGFGQTWRRFQEWHPLLLAFGTWGCIAGCPRNIRKWCLPVFALLTSIVLSIGLKRQSQMDRVAIQLATVLAFPAAILAGRIFAHPCVSMQNGTRGKSATVFGAIAARGIALSSLFAGAFVAHAHFANSAGFKLWPANDAIIGYAGFIRNIVPTGARFGFTGITDCKFEWGKPTYLPILSKREMMSDDYYGYPKGLTERNYPPRAYRDSLDKYLFFSDAYAITHWAVTDSKTKSFFDSHPEHFKEIDYRMLQSTHVYTYEILRDAPPKRCYHGDAEVEARENALMVFPAEPTTEEIVLRYNWRPGLKCHTPGAEISPFPVDGNLVFVSVKPNGNKRVEIGYRPSWHPLQPNFDGFFHH